MSVRSYTPYSLSLLALTLCLSACGGGSKSSSDSSAKTGDTDDTSFINCQAPEKFEPKISGNTQVQYLFSEACHDNVVKTVAAPENTYCTLRYQTFKENGTTSFKDRVDCIDASTNAIFEIPVHTDGRLMDININPNRNEIIISETQGSFSVDGNKLALHRYSTGGTRMLHKDSIFFQTNEQHHFVYNPETGKRTMDRNASLSDFILVKGQTANIKTINNQFYVLTSAYGGTLFKLNETLDVIWGTQFKPQVSSESIYRNNYFFDVDPETGNSFVAVEVNLATAKILEKHFNIDLNLPNSVSTDLAYTFITRIDSTGNIVDQRILGEAKSDLQVEGVSFKDNQLAVAGQFNTNRDNQSLNSDVFLTTYDVHTQQLQEYTFDFEGSDKVSALARHPNGLLTIAGVNGKTLLSEELDRIRTQGFVALIDHNGKVQNYQTILGPRSTTINSLQWLNSKEALLGATLDSYSGIAMPKDGYSRGGVLISHFDQ